MFVKYATLNRSDFAIASPAVGSGAGEPVLFRGVWRELVELSPALVFDPPIPLEALRDALSSLGFRSGNGSLSVMRSMLRGDFFAGELGPEDVCFKLGLGDIEEGALNRVARDLSAALGAQALKKISSTASHAGFLAQAQAWELELSAERLARAPESPAGPARAKGAL